MLNYFAKVCERKKVIPGFRGRYSVSDQGRVFSGENEMSLIGGRYVNLCRNGAVERVDVAYLVARAFVPNLEGRPWVVHKDGDLKNNRAENLEWAEQRQFRGGRKTAASRTVVQYSKEGLVVGKYASVTEASERTSVARYLIRNCAEGKARTAGGWIFRYGD